MKKKSNEKEEMEWVIVAICANQSSIKLPFTETAQKHIDKLSEDWDYCFKLMGAADSLLRTKKLSVKQRKDLSTFLHSNFKPFQN